MRDTHDIEEGSKAYRPAGFHPVYIGDIFNNRYEVLNKIGYGVYSTVWLVRDLKPSLPGPKHEFRALKVLSAECYDGTQAPIFERERLCHREQLGYSHVCHLLDDFEHSGLNGTHVCLVFEIMGETLRSFGAWFLESRNSNLGGAEVHCSAPVVPMTDIKPDNIFAKFRDYLMIKSHYLAGVPIPRQNPSEERYTYYFNEGDKARFSEFDITLGDCGVSSWADRHLSETIQPVALRSPEVLIHAPWNASADFWNLGAVVLELHCAVRMFSGAVPPDGHYEVKEHLAEMDGNMAYTLVYVKIILRSYLISGLGPRVHHRQEVYYCK